MFEKILIEHFTSIIWFLFAIVTLMLFYKPIRYDLLRKIDSLKAMGVELSFTKESLGKVVEIYEAKELHEKIEVAATSTILGWKVTITKNDINRVLGRIKNHIDILKYSKVLWIDDNPEYCLDEVRLLDSLNIYTQFATTTDEAMKLLETKEYDLIISDMSRGDDHIAGLNFLSIYSKQSNPLPVIFYVGRIFQDQGTPPLAFGITNRPDELLHLIMDSLERRKYQN